MTYEEVTGMYKSLDADAVSQAASKLHDACERAKCSAQSIRDEAQEEAHPLSGFQALRK